MPRIFFNIIPLNNPGVRIEPAIDCDGSACGRSFHDDDGNPLDLPPHYHLMESEVGARTRVYALGGELPEDVYEPSH